MSLQINLQIYLLLLYPCLSLPFSSSGSSSTFHSTLVHIRYSIIRQSLFMTIPEQLFFYKIVCISPMFFILQFFTLSLSPLILHSAQLEPIYHLKIILEFLHLTFQRALSLNLSMYIYSQQCSILHSSSHTIFYCSPLIQIVYVLITLYF